MYCEILVSSWTWQGQLQSEFHWRSFLSSLQLQSCLSLDLLCFKCLKTSKSAWSTEHRYLALTFGKVYSHDSHFLFCCTAICQFWYKRLQSWTWRLGVSRKTASWGTSFWLMDSLIHYCLWLSPQLMRCLSVAHVAMSCLCCPHSSHSLFCPIWIWCLFSVSSCRGFPTVVVSHRPGRLLVKMAALHQTLEVIWLQLTNRQCGILLCVELLCVSQNSIDASM